MPDPSTTKPARRRASRTTPARRAATAVAAAVAPPQVAPAVVQPAPAPAIHPLAPAADTVADDPLAAMAGQARAFDRAIHAGIGQIAGGLSPIGLSQAWADWAAHLAAAPGRQGWLAASAAAKARELMRNPDGGRFAEAAAADRRFRADLWRTWPFSALAATHKAVESWWQEATEGLPGVSAHHQRVTGFVARQMLDMASPSNFFWTNPEVLAATRKQRGANLLRGASHLAQDAMLQLTGRKGRALGAFQVGRTLAVTPGKVVWRNHLIELIQYTPATPEVDAVPLLIVPAWIMKYYILDLTAQDSMIRWLVAQGFTVFCISWRNPTPEDAGLGFDDYLEDGVMAALDQVTRIVPGAGVHLAGYCLGGTLSAVAGALMAREGDARLRSLTLMAAQTDFTEPGELGLFISDSQLALLDDMMFQQGGLRAGQMAGAFQLLKSNDLIWSRMQREYLLGQRGEPNDLMAWNADATRMPWRMHSRYLREIYLENRLAQGSFEVRGAPVSLTDLRLPIFAVGTEADHVAPWRSVYKIAHVTDAPVTFALASAGHNGGIISPPGHPRRSYRLRAIAADAIWQSPDQWAEAAERHPGSWWEAWAVWLHDLGGEKVAPPAMGGADGTTLCDAPGVYVYQ